MQQSPKPQNQINNCNLGLTGGTPTPNGGFLNLFRRVCLGDNKFEKERDL